MEFELQTNPNVIKDASQKRELLRKWMDEHGMDAVIISTADNFAWITSGGNNKVINDSEGGVGHIVISRDHHYLISMYMDADRLIDDQVPGQGYELVTMYWYEGDEKAKVKSLVSGKIGADTAIPGTENISGELINLQWPLTSLELERYRWLGKQHSDVIEKILFEVQPGISELEILRQIVIELAKRDIKLDVPICGSDERILKYRHILATEKKLEKYLLIGPVISRWGLHSLCSRSLYFGEPPAEIQSAFKAAATIEGRIFTELREGLKFKDILELQKMWYADVGHPDGWKFHYQGGPTGYVIVDCGQNQTDNVVCAPQPFSWFTTIRGAKVEELAILTKDGLEIASLSKNWPTIEVETDKGLYSVPGMLIR